MQIYSKLYDAAFNRIQTYSVEFRRHDYRHTHATKLLEKGCNPKYVQARLGHGKLETALKLYAHVTATMETTAALLSDSFLPQSVMEIIPEVAQAIVDIESINGRPFPPYCKDIVSSILGQTIFKLKNLQKLLPEDAKDFEK